MIAQCEKCGTVHADTELHGCHCHCGGVIYLRNEVRAPAGKTVVDSAELAQLKAGAAGLVRIIGEHACANNVMSADLAHMRRLMRNATDYGMNGRKGFDAQMARDTRAAMLVYLEGDSAATRAAAPSSSPEANP